MFQSSLCCYYWNADISKRMVRHQTHLLMFIGSKVMVKVTAILDLFYFRVFLVLLLLASNKLFTFS